MKYFYFISRFFLIFFTLFLFSPTKQSVYASTWVTLSTFNNQPSVTVQPNQNIEVTINTSNWIENSDPSDTNTWYSTQYTISNQNPICVDTLNYDTSGFHNQTFNIISPNISDTYDVTIKAFSGENCSGGAINTPLIATKAIIVEDTIAPDTNIISYPDLFSKNNFASFSFSSDESASFECKLDSEVFSPCNNPKDFLNLSVGSHTFSVRAIDMSSNIDPSPASYTWIIDNISPTVSINPQITNNKIPKLTGGIDDNTASISVKINGESYPATNNINGTWEVNIINNLPDGTYDVTITAIDLVGNIGTDSTSNEIIIDSVAPTATFKHYLDGVEFTGSVAYINNLNKLSFTGSYTDSNPSSQLLQDSYVIFQAQNDGSFKFSQNNKKSYCTWRKEPNLVHLSNNNYTLTTPELFTKCISDLPEGEYYMSHQVYDHAIRKDIPSITQFRDVLGLHFIIDKTSPIITTSTYSTAPTNQNITITASTNEGTLNTISHTFTENSSFDFIATDASGNITTKTVTITNIDKQKPTKPEIIGFKNPNLNCNSFTNQKYITVDWSDSTDNVAIAGYDYLIDYPKTDGLTRGSWQTYFTQSQYRGSLNEGIHNIKIRAKDTAGNVSDWSEACSITYDSIKPVLKSKTSFSGWYNSDQISSFQYTDINLLDNYADPTCTISTEGSNQTCTLNANVCDKAGNCNPTLVISNSANIDKIIPTPTTQPTNSPTNTPTPTPSQIQTQTSQPEADQPLAETPTSSPEILGANTNIDNVYHKTPTPTQLTPTPTPTNLPTNYEQVLGEKTSSNSGRWLPILFIISFVFNFFYLKYSNRFLNLIPFIISSLFFIIDWLMLKKYGCEISWLNHYFWIGGILSWVIPVGIKNKIYKK